MERAEKVFVEIRWTLVEAVIECIKGIVWFADYASRRNFVEGVFRGDHIRKLQDAFFNKEFYERVLTLPEDLMEEELTIEEEEEIKGFLKNLLNDIKIAVYLDFHEFASLIEKDTGYNTSSQLSIVIDLPSSSNEKKIPLVKSEALCQWYQKANPAG